MNIAPCVNDKNGAHQDDCPRHPFCTAHLLWDKIGASIRNLLDATTLESIVADVRKNTANHPMHNQMFHI